MERKISEVYFCEKIESEDLVNFYNEIINKINFQLNGNIAIKVHSGEKGNQNFLTPDYLAPLINNINGTIVECNTAYPGARNTTEKHLKLLEEHGWTQFKTDILDSEQPDHCFDVSYGKYIKKNYVGKHIINYNSCVVISHFKGHPMGGFGGALKQLSIGFASSYGKQYIHGYGNLVEGKKNLSKVQSNNQEAFVGAMADAAASVYNYFKDNIIFINILKNISVSCDCDANAPAPTMDDIGVCISLDPVAIDQACLDLIYNSDDNNDELIERISEKKGNLITKDAQVLGIGSTNYKLMEIEVR